MKYFLCDIEGTVSDIQFVHNVLFPYAYKNLESYFLENIDSALISEVRDSVDQTLSEENGEIAKSAQEQIKMLLKWIEQDRKHPALKKIQGPIWKEGFEKGDFQSHLYEDVPPAFENWKSSGHKIGIYSSGSIAAQKLFFKHTQFGDLTSFLSDHFDLTTGSKKESQSYEKISRELRNKHALNPQDIIFLSDVPSELSAAETAGIKTWHSQRPGIEKCDQFRSFQSFSEISTEDL